jgi:AraC family transcriptional regulator of adaptative response/methylated-DNA-[protein]-cysteine methyltransferase
MSTSKTSAELPERRAADVIIPLIRAAATIGFVIAPCSLGFVIIAMSEQLIRSIMVGDDPEMLVSDLQNQFPNAAIEVTGNCDAGLIAKVVDLIERPDQALDLPLDISGTVSYTFLAEQSGVANAVRAVPRSWAVNYLPHG